MKKSIPFLIFLFLFVGSVAYGQEIDKNTVFEDYNGKIKITNSKGESYWVGSKTDSLGFRISILNWKNEPAKMGMAIELNTKSGFVNPANAIKPLPY